MVHSPLLGLAWVLAATPLARADITTAINAKSNWGTWEGWGTSLAWWAKQFGHRDDLADAFFTLKSTTVNSQTLPGLGFNIVRYNAGASSWKAIGSERMVESKNIKRSRQIEGFWLDWNSADASSSSWDWSVDANQRAALQKAVARGANRTELFSNSPMWWMCKNHNPSGASDGSENIQSWNLEQHAVYMATVAQEFQTRFGIRFETVDPFNEPSANWWKADGTQEGCHIDVATQSTIVNHLSAHLSRRGLATVISASDESLYDQALATLRAIGSTALSNIARIHVHGYQYGSGNRAGLRDAARSAGKPLWQSEYGDGVGSGENLARYLLQDMRQLRPTAWVYWQVLDGGGWGLIDADNDANRLGVATQKYFVLAQFARHIRPGMRILDGGRDNVVAAYDASGAGKLVIVAVNWDAPQYINFDLSGFSQRPAEGVRVPRWRTHIGSGDRYAQFTSDTSISGSRFWSYFEKNTVQTFEVTGVKL
ncbi:glycoside hydrolase family 30 protein [Parathielavia appendiculata]|uniref:Glycoside hydrolase family 30 protein n=1 Tax=Parathielavia appendiculata TaxID=2587402 RepID=A0AAN6TRK1_9PEZI|nr:glycoside hydrolase family 30 protein [Parathielavia appendiculata]